MSKRRLALIGVAIALGIVALLAWWATGFAMPPVGPWRYVASAGSTRVHARSCVWADQIRGDRVYFSNPETAAQQGYEPCPVCLP